MGGVAGSSGGQLWGERLFRAASAPASLIAASVLISASLVFLPLVLEWRYLVLGTLLFSAGAAAVLMGGVARRLAYFVFLVQISASVVLPLSLYVTVAFMVFLIPLLIAGGGTGKIDAIPFHKPMVLILAGWIVSLIYVAAFSHSRHTYMHIYDIYLLLGFGVAYMVFAMLRLKYLDVERMVFYIAHSGLFFVGMTLALYVIKGETDKILSDRFGMSANVNASFLALYLNMTLSCAIFLAVSGKCSAVRKASLLVSAAIQVVAALMTASRGGFIGIGVIAAFYIWRKRSWKLLLVSVAGAAAAFLTIGQKMVERIANPTINELLSDFGRVELLKAAFKILRDNYYMFGIGMNNYSLIKFDYGFPAWFDAARNKGFSSHNTYMELWLGWGILGLAGWLLFNIGIIWALFRCRNKELRGVADAVAFALITFLLFGLGDSNIASYSMMFTYFSLAGAALFIVTHKPDGALPR